MDSYAASCEPLKLTASLADKAVDIQVQHGMTLKVAIHSKTTSETTNRALPLFLLPTSTVADVKLAILKYWNIPPEEQQLSWPDGTPLLHGPLLEQDSVDMPRPPTEVWNISLERVLPSPHLVSLLQIVRLDDWQEKDRLMAEMAVAMLHQGRQRDATPPLDLSLVEPSTFFCLSCYREYPVWRSIQRDRPVQPIQGGILVLCHACFLKVVHPDNNKGHPVKLGHKSLCRGIQNLAQEILLVWIRSSIISRIYSNIDTPSQQQLEQFHFSYEYTPGYLLDMILSRDLTGSSNNSLVLPKGIHVIIESALPLAHRLCCGRERDIDLHFLDGVSLKQYLEWANHPKFSLRLVSLDKGKAVFHRHWQRMPETAVCPPRCEGLPSLPVEEDSDDDDDL